MDSSSNSTFMNLQFALTTSYTIVKDTTKMVFVARGGKLWFGSFMPTTTLSTRPHQFQQSFRILELPGHEIVLGSNWMAQHSLVAFHYKPRQLSLFKDKTLAIKTLACESLATTAEINSTELHKLLEGGAAGYSLHLIMDTTFKKPDQQVVLAEIQQVLEEHASIFKDLEGLPPKRECDHKIPLKAGAKPPNSRPYRVPHLQKDELERQIDELLKSKVIREIQSPYSSPAILVMKKDEAWRLCIDY